MIICGSINEFTNNYTISILKSLNNVQLWQFSVSNNNSYNIKKELYELENNNIGLWSKPANYDKYKDKNNILLITDKENTYVMLFNEYNTLNKNSLTSDNLNTISNTNLEGRKWWDNNYKENGIIQIKLLGILNYERKILAEACYYKRFSIGNKFQPIKKVTLGELLNNLESINRLS